MNISDAPYEYLETLLHLLRQGCVEELEETPYSGCDIEEVWDLYDKVALEMQKREELSKTKEVLGYYLIHQCNGYQIFKIKKVLSNEEVIIESLIYNDDSETLKYIDDWTADDLYDTYGHISITLDKRVLVVSHDDYGGSAFAKEITEEEYNRLMNLPCKYLDEEVKQKYWYTENF